MIESLSTPHGDLSLPAFLPDATRGVVRSVDANDVRSAGIRALMVNTLHLSSQPGTSIVKEAGGIHRFAGWDGPVASDSGGFQVLSMAAGGPRGVTVSRKGLSYKLEGQSKKRLLTPDRCIQYQVQLGADLLFCLDHCPPAGADQAAHRESVDHTVSWARQCKEALEKRYPISDVRYPKSEEQQHRQLPAADRPPLLFAVVQGGDDQGLRAECAERLIELGFDGFGFGGWPIADDGGLVDAVGQVSDLLPDDVPLHGLGIGKPENVQAAWEMGYHTFDCTLPTRDARQGRLYLSTSRSLTSEYEYLYIEKERFNRDQGPVDENCDCAACSRYTRAYLHHLFCIGEPAGARLATIHNLRFYARLMDALASRSGT